MVKGFFSWKFLILSSFLTEQACGVVHSFAERAATARSKTFDSDKTLLFFAKPEELISMEAY